MYIRKLIISLSLCLIGMAVTSCGNSSHYIAVQLVGSDLWSIVDLNTGEVIYKDKFKNRPSAIVNGKFCVSNDSSFEYFTIDNVAKPINKERYRYATSFSDNDVAIVVPVDKGITLIDGNCNVIASLNDTITWAREFSYGYAAVCKSVNGYDQWGYINENGEVVINLSYDYAHDFSKDGIAIVEDIMHSVLARPAVQTTKYHAIDTKGNKLFSLDAYEYQAVGKFSDGYLPAQKQNGDVVLLDKTGKEVCSIGHFDNIYDLKSRDFTNGEYYIYKEKDSYGFKKMTGEVAIRAKYNGIIPLPFPGHDYYLAQKQGKGETTHYSDGVSVSELTDSIGIINSRDETIVPFEYSEYDEIYVIPQIEKSGDLVLFTRTDGSSLLSLKNSKLEELGHNGYKNFSNWLRASITSNYFNVNNVDSLTSGSYYFSDSTFYETRRGMTLGDLESAHLLDEFYYVTDYDTMIKATWKGGGDTKYYYFDRNIDSDYDYGYDGNAKLIAVISGPIYYLTESQPGAEEALAEAFDTLIQKKGFSPVEGQPHWFLSNKGGMAVALSYKNGEIYLNCTYSHYYDIVRIPRSEQITASFEPYDITYSDDNYNKFKL